GGRLFDGAAVMKKNSKQKFDEEIVRSLAKVVEETGMTEIEVETGDFRVRVARNFGASLGMPNHLLHAPMPANYPGQPAQNPAPAAAPAAEAPVKADPAAHPGALKSPMVGAAYTAPEPGA